MKRRFTVEAEYTDVHADKHRTRSFATMEAAYDYAKWARYRALFAWALVRGAGRPLLIWASGDAEPYWVS